MVVIWCDTGMVAWCTRHVGMWPACAAPMPGLTAGTLQLTEEGALAAVQAVVKKQHMSKLELNENQISSQGVHQLKVSSLSALH